MGLSDFIEHLLLDGQLNYCCEAWMHGDKGYLKKFIINKVIKPHISEFVNDLKTWLKGRDNLIEKWEKRLK